MSNRVSASARDARGTVVGGSTFVAVTGAGCEDAAERGFASEVSSANTDKIGCAGPFWDSGDTNESFGELSSCDSFKLLSIGLSVDSSSVVGAFGGLSSKERDESHRESARDTDGSLLWGRVDAIGFKSLADVVRDSPLEGAFRLEAPEL
jgi:hypothetical protein